MVKLGLVLCATIAVTTACSGQVPDDGELSTSDSSSSDPSPSSECSALLTDEAFTALGWPVESAATERAGRCERGAADVGTVTVGTRAVPDPGPESALSVLEEQCEGLGSGGQYVDRRVAWLGPELTDSCFVDLAPTGTGVAELYFVNASDSLVQVRVAALEPVESEQVHQAMSQLAEAANDLES